MKKTVLHINGMMCGMCESHINDVIRREFKIKKVTSSHSKGITEILSEEPLNEEQLRNAIKQTGYTLTEIEIEKRLFCRNEIRQKRQITAIDKHAKIQYNHIKRSGRSSLERTVRSVVRGRWSCGH